MRTTTIVQRQPKGFSIQPITYPVMEEQIREASEKYMALAVDGVEDVDGLKRVHDSRMEVKKMRIAIEKRRKELKSDSLEYGRQVDSAAKHLTSLLEPVEKHLEHEEGIVEREKERLRQEAEKKRQQRIRERLEALRDVGHVALAEDVANLLPGQFDALLAKHTKEHAERAELERKAEEERRRVAEEQRKESEKLAAERAELERLRQEQEAAQAKIDAEKKRIADEEVEKVRQEEIRKREQAAAEKAKQEAEEKAKRDAEEEKLKVERAEAERMRIAAMRPDHAKLIDIADEILRIRVPEVSAGAHEAAFEILGVLKRASGDVRRIANSLVDTASRDQW